MKDDTNMTNTSISDTRRQPTRAENERASRRRREDVTTNRMRNLSVDGDMDSAYEYRWINDTPGRVHNLTVRDDWDVVTSEMLGARHEKDKGVGSGVERIVDKGTGGKAILVRKLRDYYVKDKAKEQAFIDETDAAMKRGEVRSPEGLRESEAVASYVPQGGINIQDGRRG